MSKERVAEAALLREEDMRGRGRACVVAEGWRAVPRGRERTGRTQVRKLASGPPVCFLSLYHLQTPIALGSSGWVLSEHTILTQPLWSHGSQVGYREPLLTCSINRTSLHQIRAHTGRGLEPVSVMNTTFLSLWGRRGLLGSELQDRVMLAREACVLTTVALTCSGLGSSRWWGSARRRPGARGGACPGNWK